MLIININNWHKTLKNLVIIEYKTFENIQKVCYLKIFKNFVILKYKAFKNIQKLFDNKYKA